MINGSSYVLYRAIPNSVNKIMFNLDILFVSLCLIIDIEYISITLCTNLNVIKN